MPRRMNQDEIDRQYARGLAAVDPRVTDRRYRSRMNMLDDDGPTQFELGTELDEFIEPEG